MLRTEQAQAPAQLGEGVPDLSPRRRPSPRRRRPDEQAHERLGHLPQEPHALAAGHARQRRGPPEDGEVLAQQDRRQLTPRGVGRGGVRRRGQLLEEGGDLPHALRERDRAEQGLGGLTGGGRQHGVEEVDGDGRHDDVQCSG